MADPKYNFQYCPKLIIFSEDGQSILLARRHGEADYDGTFSFIGGKMEVGDTDLIAGLRREKNEEIGETANVRAYMGSAHILLFDKKDGSRMIIPHYLAQYDGGAISLNPDEYSEYRWVPLAEIDALEPKIGTIPECLAWALQLRSSLTNHAWAAL